MEDFTKAGIQGALSSGLAVYGLQSRRDSVAFNVSFIDKDIPFWAVMFGVGFASSFISDYLHLLVKKEIPRKIEDEVSLALGSLVSGASTTGLLYVLNKNSIPEFGATNAFMLGAGSELASNYINKMLY